MHTWKLVTSVTLYECVGGKSIHVVTPLHKGHGPGALFLLSNFIDGRSGEGLRTDGDIYSHPLWTEEPGGLMSMGSHRVRHNWSHSACMHALKKEMATHSSTLAWRIPGTEEAGGLPSMGSHRVRHSWSNLAATEADTTPRENYSEKQELRQMVCPWQGGIYPLSLFLSPSGQQEVISTRPPAPMPVKVVAGNQSS